MAWDPRFIGVFIIENLKGIQETIVLFIGTDLLMFALIYFIVNILNDCKAAYSIDELVY